MFEEEFIKAIHEKQKVRITFSKKDKAVITRVCAPMDYGPSKRSSVKNLNSKFHLWDYGSNRGEHVLSLSPEQIHNMEVLDESFDPSEFVTWQPDWIVKRDWGEYS